MLKKVVLTGCFDIKGGIFSARRNDSFALFFRNVFKRKYKNVATIGDGNQVLKTGIPQHNAIISRGAYNKYVAKCSWINCEKHESLTLKDAILKCNDDPTIDRIFLEADAAICDVAIKYEIVDEAKCVVVGKDMRCGDYHRDVNDYLHKFQNKNIKSFNDDGSPLEFYHCSKTAIVSENVEEQDYLEILYKTFGNSGWFTDTQTLKFNLQNSFPLLTTTKMSLPDVINNIMKIIQTNKLNDCYLYQLLRHILRDVNLWNYDNRELSYIKFDDILQDKNLHEDKNDILAVFIDIMINGKYSGEKADALGLSQIGREDHEYKITFVDGYMDMTLTCHHHDLSKTPLLVATNAFIMHAICQYVNKRSNIKMDLQPRNLELCMNGAFIPAEDMEEATFQCLKEPYEFMKLSCDYRFKKLEVAFDTPYKYHEW